MNIPHKNADDVKIFQNEYITNQVENRPNLRLLQNDLALENAITALEQGGVISLTGIVYSQFPITPSTSPSLDYQVANKKYVDDNSGIGSAVLLSGNQTVAGTKTFTSFPKTPSSSPITNYEVANKKYVDDSITNTVLVTTDQNIGGTKTFTSFPFTPSSPPISGYHVANKKYVDDNILNMVVIVTPPPSVSAVGSIGQIALSGGYAYFYSPSGLVNWGRAQLNYSW